MENMSILYLSMQLCNTGITIAEAVAAPESFKKILGFIFEKMLNNLFCLTHPRLRRAGPSPIGQVCHPCSKILKQSN